MVFQDRHVESCTDRTKSVTDKKIVVLVAFYPP